MTSTPSDVPSVPFHFRIGPAYIDYWIHLFSHWEANEGQKRTITDLEESLKSLLQKRDRLQAARGAFSRVSVYYPRAHPTPRHQDMLFSATHDFFHTYYSVVSAMLSVIRRHSYVFGEAPTRSISRFLIWWKAKGIFMDEAYPLLEEARAFRAMLDHKESHPPYTWHTADDSGLTKIFLVGPSSSSGSIPDGTFPFQGGWGFLAPDEDLITSALAVQLNAVVPEIGMHMDNAKSARCAWALVGTPDDTRIDYPTFAHRDGVVSDVYTRTISTHVTVTREA